MATISDVARNSGVSIATVSNVLNNGPKPVRADTRQRVLTAARALNYHPNAMARSLVRRRTNTLGIFFYVVESTVVITNNYASGILQGVLTATAEIGYNLTFFTRPWRDAEHSAAAFRDGRSDGLIIVAPPTDSDIIAGLSALDMTMIVIAGESVECGSPSVDVDDHLGARMATEHLLSLGHRKIAHLTGNANMRSTPLRRAEFIETLHSAGIDTPAHYILPCAYDGEMSYEQTRRLLALPDRPTAIFAGNDSIAIPALNAARDAGISVPDELSIIGFDDSPSASLVQPTLTTVRQPLGEIGAKSVQLLVDQIEGKLALPQVHLIKPDLIVRGSTAPVAS